MTSTIGSRESCAAARCPIGSVGGVTLREAPLKLSRPTVASSRPTAYAALALLGVLLVATIDDNDPTRRFLRALIQRLPPPG